MMGLKRVAISAVCLVGISLLCLVGKVAYDVHHLSFYRSYIEVNYASEISVIEQDCRDYPKGDLSSEQWDQDRKTTKAVEKLLSADEIFCAYSTTDGHHGPRCLKPMKDGFTTYGLKILGSHSPNGRHSLYYGKSFDGRNLLVYEGLVPSGGKRKYKLVFLLKGIEKR